MGTRSLTIIKGDDSEIAVMYGQYDGYIEGHGHELAHFLSAVDIVNGITDDKKRVFNGADCMAASIVAHFKKEAGGFYLMPAGSRDVGEEYIYEVYVKSSKIHIKVIRTGWGKTPDEIIFDGLPKKLAKFKG